MLFETIYHSTFLLHNYISKHHTFVGDFFQKRYKQYLFMHNIFNENAEHGKFLHLFPSLLQESTRLKWWELTAV